MTFKSDAHRKWWFAEGQYQAAQDRLDKLRADEGGSKRSAIHDDEFDQMIRKQEQRIRDKGY